MSQTRTPPYDPFASVRQQLMLSLRELEQAVMRIQSNEDLAMVLDVLRMIPEAIGDGTAQSASLVEASQLLRGARERLSRISRPSASQPAVKPTTG